MFIPGITSRAASSKCRATRCDGSKVVKRKGGGGGGSGHSSGGSGRGGGDEGGRSSGSSGSTGATGKGSPSAPEEPVSVQGLPGGVHSATVYGGGGSKITVIPSGQSFAGRSIGGGTRSGIYGSSCYGSGYPGVPYGNCGVADRPFPYYFWPIVWGGIFLTAEAYLNAELEYGSPSNTSRPGGPMAQAQFQSNRTGTTFHILADNTTVVSLISTIHANCSSYLSMTNSSTTPISYDATNSNDPVPEQAVQYYRASSVALTLDGYNNTAALGSDPNATASPLPVGIDTALLMCINATTGESVPLVNAGVQLSSGWSIAVTVLLVIVLLTFMALS
ncbi:hypothetical protein BV25DRAFT_1823927 [Artomyces pyxidatus]|uniref:Uncharacterized protein n=1 Tax=Artomyces pyxidatus TaxID=48021 RepID=A0ACB8T7C5_9AGAM|nr:hypothetical protein BV25DRAFT_1823927 [Artomyces pyxidatus]